MTTNDRPSQGAHADVLTLDPSLAPVMAILDRDLTTAYVTKAPPGIVRAVQQRALQSRDLHPKHNFHQPFNPLSWLPRQLGVVPLLLMLLAVIAIPVAAYQSVSILQRVLGTDNGLGYVVANKGGHALNLSQTIAGYTMTLHWVYADGNRVVVAYTIQQPDGQPLQRRVLSDSSLRDGHGSRLTFLGGPENVGGAYVETFQASSAALQNEQLRLRLTVPLFAALRQRDIADLQATAVIVPQAESRQFVFDFAISNANGMTVGGQANQRQVKVGQTVTVDGESATLERVVVSASETRLYLRGEGIDTTGSMPVLTAGNWNSENPSTWAPGAPVDARMWTARDGQVVISYLASLAGKHGAWTLVVNPHQRVVGTTATSTPHGGPWIFHFRMML